MEKKGKKNIKAVVNKKVEELKVEEAKVQAKIDDEKKFNREMNRRVEKDENIF